MTLGRYSRQERFQPIGTYGQALLKEKHILLIGMGALGSSLAETFVRAGIGTITLVDRDYVDLSNLQRQCLYTESDVAEALPKAIAAKRRLEFINSEVTIQAHVNEVTAHNLSTFVKDVDLILDATDNFETRYLINDISQKNNIPWIYGACVGSYGITYTILPQKTPCLRCLLGNEMIASETCDTVGIIAPTVQMVVSLQTTEAMKILLNQSHQLRKTLFSFDVWKNEVSSIHVDHLKKSDCPSCGEDPKYPALQGAIETKITVLCGRDTVQIRSTSGRLDLKRLGNSLQKKGNKPHSNDYLISFQIERYRLVAFRDGRVLVHGANDKETANALYQQYIVINE